MPLQAARLGVDVSSAAYRPGVETAAREALSLVAEGDSLVVIALVYNTGADDFFFAADELGLLAPEYTWLSADSLVPAQAAALSLDPQRYEGASSLFLRECQSLHAGNAVRQA